jgi:hypothetical protein
MEQTVVLHYTDITGMQNWTQPIISIKGTLLQRNKKIKIW